MHLYLQSDRSLEETANSIAGVALPSHERQLRDGLNLGGGEYFKFFTNESEILLVCNDKDHMEVFVEEKAIFPFYCYARKGGDAILEAMFSSKALVSSVNWVMKMPNPSFKRDTLKRAP